MAAAPDGPTISTSHGQIRGKTVEFEWGKVDAFYGIPYAQPPVGQLRFEKTRPLQVWEGVRDALELPPMAIPWVRPANWERPEVREQYSEDCLYLNLFRPHRPQHEEEEGEEKENPMSSPKGRQQLLPVLAIIHGGGFQSGSARRYGDLEEIGRKYLSRGILVAVVQYRIGIFGFASSGQSDFAGNFAYWDQTEALRWLRPNLVAFGGDPQRLTLFGYSSGATCVSTLTVSPHSRDLFAKSVQMSGSVMVCRAASEKVVEETQKLAQAMGSGQPGKAIKENLKEKSVDDFFDGIDKIGSTRVGLNYVKFGPRLDGDFLPADFPELIAQAKPKPTIIGISEMEPLRSVLFGTNSSLHWDAIPWEQFGTFGRAQFEEYIRRVVVDRDEFGADAADGLVKDLMEFYLDAPPNGHDKSADFFLERVVQVMADLQFVVPFVWEVGHRVKAATAAQHNSPHAHQPPHGGTRLFAYITAYVNARWFPPQVQLHKSFHDNDHSYVFRNPSESYVFDAADEAIERHWNTFIANFVHTGDPSNGNFTWLPIVQSGAPSLRHMLMEWPAPKMCAALQQRRRVDFWERMIAKYPEYNLVMGRKVEVEEAAAMAPVPIMMENGAVSDGMTTMKGAAAKNEEKIAPRLVSRK